MRMSKIYCEWCGRIIKEYADDRIQDICLSCHQEMLEAVRGNPRKNPDPQLARYVREYRADPQNSYAINIANIVSRTFKFGKAPPEGRWNEQEFTLAFSEYFVERGIWLEDSYRVVLDSALNYMDYDLEGEGHIKRSSIKNIIDDLASYYEQMYTSELTELSPMSNPLYGFLSFYRPDFRYLAVDRVIFILTENEETMIKVK
jgi:hypothetical protein